MRFQFLIITLCVASTGSPQLQKKDISERYKGYIAEATQWLLRGDFERAEKTARFAISYSQDNNLSERPAMVVLAQSFFRQMRWADAANSFVSSVRPGKMGSIDGMYAVSCIRANKLPNGLNALLQHLDYWGATFPDELAGLTRGKSEVVEATGWIIIAMHETGALGAADAQMAVKLAPESMTAWWVLGQRQMETKKFKEARNSFAKVSEGKIEGLAKKAKAKIKECDAALKAADKKKDGEA